jgi:hypothetical protein
LCDFVRKRNSEFTSDKIADQSGGTGSGTGSVKRDWIRNTASNYYLFFNRTIMSTPAVQTDGAESVVRGSLVAGPLEGSPPLGGPQVVGPLVGGPLTRLRDDKIDLLMHHGLYNPPGKQRPWLALLAFLLLLTSFALRQAAHPSRPEIVPIYAGL